MSGSGIGVIGEESLEIALGLSFPRLRNKKPCRRVEPVAGTHPRNTLPTPPRLGRLVELEHIHNTGAIVGQIENCLRLKRLGCRS
jgi:hypothetical protein